jgi:hypothetical protein
MFIHRKRHVPPSQRRMVRNGPQPAKRAAAEATLRALISLLSTTRPVKASARSVASPPTRRMHVAARASRAARLARSGHPVGCHTARGSAPQCSTTSARRAVRHPTAWPSARPTGAVAAPALAHGMRCEFARTHQCSLRELGRFGLPLEVTSLSKCANAKLSSKSHGKTRRRLLPKAAVYLI